MTDEIAEVKAMVKAILASVRPLEGLRPIVIGARFIAITGRLQRESGVVHVVAERAEDLTHLLTLLSANGGDVTTLARADEISRPILDPRPKRLRSLLQLFEHDPETAMSLRQVLPKGRNFQ